MPSRKKKVALSLSRCRRAGAATLDALDLAQKHGLPTKRTLRVRPTSSHDALAAEAVVALRPRAVAVRLETYRALDVEARNITE